MTSNIYISVQDPVHSEGLFVGLRFAAGDLARNPKVFIGSLIPSLSFACQLLLHQQGHSIALCDSQSLVCSFRAVISRSKRLGGVSTKLVNQFTRAIGEVRIPACSGHSLWHGKIYTPAKSQQQQITPSKTSYLAKRGGFMLLGINTRKGAILPHQLSFICMHLISGESSA